MNNHDDKNKLNYDQLVDQALKTVVSKVIKKLSETPDLGEHHFFITFDTNHHTVEIPESFHKQHPFNMTIVLQHQFWDLKVQKDFFSVILSFNGKHQNLKIGFDAITQFSDPSTDFALQFASFNSKNEKNEANQIKDSNIKPQNEVIKKDDLDIKSDVNKKDEEKKKQSGEIISLDNFRKR